MSGSTTTDIKSVEPDSKTSQPVRKRKPTRAERYASADGYSAFRTDQQSLRRLLIDGLVELTKTTDDPKPTAAAAAAAASDPKPVSNNAKSVINAATYGLYFGIRMDATTNSAFVADRTVAEHAVRYLQPMTDGALSSLTTVMKQQLRNLMIVSDLRKLSTGMTANSTAIAWRLVDSIVDLMADAVDDEIDSPSFKPSSPSYYPSDFKLNDSAVGPTGRKIISLKRPQSNVVSINRPPTPTGYDSGFRFPSDDASDDEKPSAAAVVESHLKTTVCAGCDEQKKCGRININAEQADGTKYLRFRFGYADRIVNGFKYNIKNDDWLCCYCAVAILHAITRAETLVSQQKTGFEIEGAAVSIGPIGCGCKTCGDVELSIPDAYAARILYDPATDNDSDDRQASPKKPKTDPNAIKPSEQPSETAAASAAASDDS